MALGSLQFVYHIDGDGANLVDSMDLLNFAQGFELAEGGWVQQIPAGDNVTLIETLTFRVKATSQDDLATRLQVLDNWITRVGYYQSRAMRTAVWLRVKVAGESEYRQALITRMQYAINESAFGTLWADAKFIGTLTIVLERSAFWEEITPQSDSNFAESNYFKSAASGAIGGDVSARVFSGNVVALDTSNNQNSTWIGFKDARYFDPSSGFFHPERPLFAYDTGVGTDSTFVDDTDAIVTKALQITFATAATLVQRHNLPLNAIATYSAPNITASELSADYTSGEYLVLMRAKTTSTAVTRARIKLGYKNAPTADRVYPRVTISSTVYRLYEMGQITVPPQRLSGLSNQGLFSVLSAALKVDAERVSGTGNLLIDAYILIPLDGAIKLYTDGGYVGFMPPTAVTCQIETTPINEVFAYTTDSVASINDTCQVSPFAWGVPVSVGTLAPVVVFASSGDTTGSDKTSSYAITIQYFRRWRTLRGNE